MDNVELFIVIIIVILAIIILQKFGIVALGAALGIGFIYFSSRAERFVIYSDEAFSPAPQLDESRWTPGSPSDMSAGRESAIFENPALPARPTNALGDDLAATIGIARDQERRSRCGATARTADYYRQNYGNELAETYDRVWWGRYEN